MSQIPAVPPASANPSQVKRAGQYQHALRMLCASYRIAATTALSIKSVGREFISCAASCRATDLFVFRVILYHRTHPAVNVYPGVVRANHFGGGGEGCNHVVHDRRGRGARVLDIMDGRSRMTINPGAGRTTVHDVFMRRKN